MFDRVLATVSLALLVCVLASGSSAVIAGGQTFTPTRTDDPPPNGCDPEDCSLREAVIAANTSPGPDIVQLAAATYVLAIGAGGEVDPAAGDIEITDDLMILGAAPAGAGQGVALTTTIDAGQNDRALEVVAQGSEVSAEVRHVHVTGGAAASSGGGILANGAISAQPVHLTLTNSAVTGNTANSAGGGVAITNNFAGGSTMTIVGSVISENQAFTFGGGIYNSAPLTLQNSSVTGNNVNAEGGGIFSHTSTTIESSTIDGNESGSAAGGIGSTGLSSTLTINNSTISNNTAGADGGGMRAEFTSVEIHDSTISGNSAGTDGGGVDIDNALASAVITGSTITGNQATEDGGGLDTDGTTTITGATISDNQAGGDGGGIVNTESLTLTDSVVSNNTAGDDGGGIDIDEAVTQAPPINITRTTISGNTAQDTGGGIDNDGTMTVEASTVSGNTANGEGGGGIENDKVLTLVNSTVSGNTTSGVGGGIYQAELDDQLTLRFSTIANNTAIGGNPVVRPAGGPLAGGGVHAEGTAPTMRATLFADNSPLNCVVAATDSDGDNIATDLSCKFTGGANDDAGTDPQLGPLAANGGPTLTHSLLPGSPAIDNASNCPPPDADQRGTERPQGPSCDSGAYELVQGLIWGDNNCSGAPLADDGLPVLNHLAEVARTGVSTDGECPPIGQQLGFPGGPLWGDVNCSDAVDAQDMLDLLADIAGLDYDRPGDCPDIGDVIALL